MRCKTLIFHINAIDLSLIIVIVREKETKLYSFDEIVTAFIVIKGEKKIYRYIWIWTREGVDLQ